MDEKALEGLRVVLFGAVWAGPSAVATMADFGAEVIRVESRRHPDSFRFIMSQDRTNLEKGPYFQTLNRNTMSVTLDLSRKRAKDLAKTLVKTCDVVVENQSPGVMERRGLGYSVLKEIKPDLIMASISGYGQTGPLTHDVAYGPTMSSFSGLDSLVGYPDGRPLGIHRAYYDLVGSMAAVFAVLTALRHRARTGEGQYIDIALGEAGITLLGREVMDHVLNGRNAGPRGNRHPSMAPHGYYPCKDHDTWITLACGNEEEWKALCLATENPQWLEDPRFSDAYGRLKHQDELNGFIAQWTVRYTPPEAMEILQEAGVAAVPCHDIVTMFMDPHAQDQEYFVPLPHPQDPDAVAYNNPWKLSETPSEIRRHAPLLGEHNRYVLQELCGVSEEQFQILVQDKVVY